SFIKKEMRMLTRQVARVVLCLMVGLSVSAQHAAALPTLSLDPASQMVQPFQFFALDVNIIDVTDLYGFQFELAFTPAVFAQGKGSITPGAFFPSADTDFTPGTIDESAGTGTFTFATLVGLPQGIDGSGTLATIQLKTLAQGGTISLTSVLLTNSTFDEIP